MNRKKFLQHISITGLGAMVLPATGFAHTTQPDEPSNEELLKTTSCAVTPGETAGPYPLPSGVSTTGLVRQNITEGTQTGIPLTLTLTIVNAQNSCVPVSGLRVDIWHCNKRGYYSAYSGQPGIDGTQDTTGTTWLRGIQYTDASGNVTFTSVYPGWYTPRATHIHVEVFNGTTLLETTQVCFPDALNSTVNTFYATSGTNPVTNETDMVFSDSYADELMTVTGDNTAGYTASKTIVINAGTLGVEDVELETGGQFSKLTNFPNPFSDDTTVSFELTKPADVVLLVLDIAGRELLKTNAAGLTAGKHALDVDTTHLAAGCYLYRLQVTNEKGTFSQTRKMLKA